MYTTEKVMNILVSYKNNKRKIELLKFELANMPRISDEDVIDSLALSSSLYGGDIIMSSHLSDKTMMIAMKYHDTGQELRDDVYEQISKELVTLQNEIKRLEYYLSLLPEESATIITRYYFDGKYNKEIASELDITVPTLLARKKTAINELVSLYQYLSSVRD